MIYILAGRPAYVRPISFDHYQQLVREDYEQQLASAAEKMVSGGVLVVFDELEADDLALIDQLKLELLADFPQAMIYASPQESS